MWSKQLCSIDVLLIAMKLTKIFMCRIIFFSMIEKFLPFELASFWASTSLHSRAWKGHSKRVKLQKIGWIIGCCHHAYSSNLGSIIIAIISLKTRLWLWARKTSNSTVKLIRRYCLQQWLDTCKTSSIIMSSESSPG